MSKNYESLWRMYGYWTMDMVRDPRVIHNVPATYRRGSRQLAEMAQVNLSAVTSQRPVLALSFDVEQDVWEKDESGVSETAAPFLRDFMEYSGEGDLRASFFVQGSMVERISPLLESLVFYGHSVGLHGYHHEQWGRTNWVRRRAPIVLSERRRRLELGVAAFEGAGLPFPCTFRAPNFTIDRHTYALLSEYGITLDSSSASQRGNQFVPLVKRGVRVVPVSCSPRPMVYRNVVIPLPTAIRFKQFNFDVFVSSPIDDLLRAVDETMRFQASQGIHPHILMYAHNWEFYSRNGSYVIRALCDRAMMLAERFNMVSGNLLDLADRLFTADFHREAAVDSPEGGRI